MSQPLTFGITNRSAENTSRTGIVTTPHGAFKTPAFMPVGTRGTIKGLTPAQVVDTGSEILLNNAYHLMLRPGDETSCCTWRCPLFYEMGPSNLDRQRGIPSMVDGRY